MNNQDYKALKFSKLIEGKSLEQAHDEIKRLIDSQKGFKELKREVIRLEKLNEKLTKDLEKKTNKSKDFKTQFKIDTEKVSVTEKKTKEINESKNEEATLRDINRVMGLIDTEKRICLGDLSKTCHIKPKLVKGVLNFLVRYNLIKTSGEYNSLVIERIGSSNGN